MANTKRAEGTGSIKLSRGWLQFCLAVAGSLFFAGVAWGLSDYRIKRIEEVQREQAAKFERALDQIQRMDKTQGRIEERQTAIAKGVDEIKAILSKPK